MKICNIDLKYENKPLINLEIGECTGCISEENAKKLKDKFKNKKDMIVYINELSNKKILDISVNYLSPIVDCHENDEKPFPLLYELRAKNYK